MDVIPEGRDQMTEPSLNKWLIKGWASSTKSGSFNNQTLFKGNQVKNIW